MCWNRIIVASLIILFIGATKTTLAVSNDEILVRLEGKILDANTLEPVSAKLVYKIIPSGNITGIRMFANDNGEYLVQLQKNHTYKIEVSSTDYQPTAIELNTQDNEYIYNDFHLYKIPEKGEVFNLSNDIYFERDDFSINKNSIPTLQTLSEILKDQPKMKIRLEGHTDKGALKSLFHLSESRVNEVKRYLVEEAGIDKKRIKTKAFGGTKPISDDNTAEARQLNRRVEVRVIQL